MTPFWQLAVFSAPMVKLSVCGGSLSGWFYIQPRSLKEDVWQPGEYGTWARKLGNLDLRSICHFATSNDYPDTRMWKKLCGMHVKQKPTGGDFGNAELPQ
jgi:hypothetical protein